MADLTHDTFAEAEEAVGGMRPCQRVVISQKPGKAEAARLEEGNEALQRGGGGADGRVGRGQLGDAERGEVIA